MKHIFAVIVLALFSTTAFAQLEPTITTSADGVHYRGAWYAGTTETVLINARTSAPSTAGYVNTTAIGGAFHLYSAGPGFNSYMGTISYEPTKALATFLNKVTPAISADYVRFSVHGDVGDTVPALGSPYFTGGAGAQVDVALMSSGALVWNTVYAGWQNPGIVIVKSGLQYYFGGTSSTASLQAPKSAKIRRVLAEFKH
jgi:hypothetical protein